MPLKRPPQRSNLKLLNWQTAVRFLSGACQCNWIRLFNLFLSSFSVLLMGRSRQLFQLLVVSAKTTIQHQANAKYYPSSILCGATILLLPNNSTTIKYEKLSI